MKTLPVNTGVDSVSPPRAHPSTGSQSGSATPVWTVLIELGGGLPNFSYCLSILDPAVTGERASALLDLRRRKSPNTANLHLNSIALREPLERFQQCSGIAGGTAFVNRHLGKQVELLATAAGASSSTSMTQPLWSWT